ncbi:GyrI-like domain-containing protein [Arenibacter sp. GZD96]|uniref:GyrI-like domain-containing protein n=1 Tax=Aurantibrevibacter litoralis TaxID=3106030 RepID=UPI002AFE73A9|nr:GyrI-like domain-containing protein [Arenibacter sp. GZD-96]MEA1785539.1 GyrI-like domain-containing protein [Arenibacter sp. GZD-96]
MKKIVLYSLLVVVAISLIWYLFLKPYDYLVGFSVIASPGTIEQSIKQWGADLENAKFIDPKNKNNITQQFNFNDSIHRYKWEIKRLNDSLTRVNIFVKDIDNSLYNRIFLPFSEPVFEKRTKNTLYDFHKKLKGHLDNFKVTIVGEDMLSPTFCVYVSQKGLQIEKAKKMMHDYPLLNQIVANNNIEPNGPPRIEVTRWDMENDSIIFDFCFPILKGDSLPYHPEIKYKNLKGRKALKAIYNGNYVTSDRAWYALLDYAKEKGYEVENAPVEIFYNNPNYGGDELNWKAEIFLPLKP